VKKRFSEEQIIGFLKEADTGVPVKELARKYGFSDASFYLWRSKFGGMDVPDAKRLKSLEVGNARLKKLLAESMLENEVTREALRENVCPAPRLQGLLLSIRERLVTERTAVINQTRGFRIEYGRRILELAGRTLYCYLCADDMTRRLNDQVSSAR